MRRVAQTNRLPYRERGTGAIVQGDARALRIAPRDVMDSVQLLGMCPERQRPGAGDAVRFCQIVSQNVSMKAQCGSLPQ